MIVCIYTASYIAKATIKYGTIIPSVQSVPFGKPIKMICHSHKKPKWKLNHRKLGSIYTAGHQVFIKQARSLHDGIYQCQGWYSNGFPFISLAFVFVGGMVYCHDVVLV